MISSGVSDEHEPSVNDLKGFWAGMDGALLGLLAYGTYDMTNMATLRDWPVAMSVVDMAWGCLLTFVSAVAGFWIARILSDPGVSN